MKATHKEHDQLVGNKIITLQPGEFVTGRSSLSEDLNKGMKPKMKQSEISWWRYLNNLEQWGMLNIKKTNKYSVVSIVKWGDYQETEQQVNNNRTTDEQQMNTNKNVKNVKNEKKKDTRKQVYEETSIPFQLSVYFFERIRDNNPEYKKPNLQTWSDDVRKMIDIDKRTEEQIRYLMKWVQQDSFEMTNVLSPSKLRKRFDQLVMKVKQEKQKPKKQKEINWEDL
ncbi:replication protein [Bacillus sp. MCCB 382]|uniref:replication protein n=1 Tax=Bacillus sp. MCCB 382 TaxID=2860197 RepID=UPI001C59DBCB|nr:replication protein [Bacillus sp. MCCB 382]